MQTEKCNNSLSPEEIEKRIQFEKHIHQLNVEAQRNKKIETRKYWINRLKQFVRDLRDFIIIAGWIFIIMHFIIKFW